MNTTPDPGPAHPVPADPDERLGRQLQFIIEADKLKHILRQTYVANGSRRENDAEHSWHIATMAMLLSEYAGEEPLDLLRVVKMLLVHDVVEIDAGDTFCYDDEAVRDQAAREQQAANRLFNLLPPDQAGTLCALWEEFDARETPEARYAAALDRLQPLILNVLTAGRSWMKHGIQADQVRRRCEPIRAGAPALWTYANALIDEAVRKGYLG